MDRDTDAYQLSYQGDRKTGGDVGDLKEIKVLNRILRWTPAGITYEADPRLVEQLIKNFPPTGAPVKTAGQKSIFEGDGSPAELELQGQDVRNFRGGAARANYLAQDRPDISYPTKELCRRMHAPRRGDLRALERTVKYLASEPRLVYHYDWQDNDHAIQVYCDTDFAGCGITRKSTSGGCAMIGSHLIKHWSSTQKTVTLSSGEAELYGVVKGVAEALGLKSLGEDMRIQDHIAIDLHADSSAAIGICRRSGIGKVRHLATAQLWVQEKLKNKELKLYKVLGTENPADLLTKHVPRESVDYYIAKMHTYRGEGRPTTAPHLHANCD